MGTAMLSRDNNTPNKKFPEPSTDNGPSPPQPPPKQRSALDQSTASIIDGRKVEVVKGENNFADIEEFTKKPEPVLFEPAKPPEVAKDAAAQRFKKGNLRLTKAENGGWKLEELEEKVKNSNILLSRNLLF